MKCAPAFSPAMGELRGVPVECRLNIGGVLDDGITLMVRRVDTQQRLPILLSFEEIAALHKFALQSSGDYPALIHKL